MTTGYTRTFPNDMNQKVAIATWAALAAGENGDAFVLGQYADRTVQVAGITGGTITIQGSLDGTNYYTLTDYQGNPLVFSAAGLNAISEMVYYVRPAASGALTGTVVVTLAVKGTT
jgi:hypothetical protein